MSRRLTTSPGALEALRRARVWLTQEGSGSNGRARWVLLRECGRRIRSHPYIGTPVEGRPGRFQLIVSDYRIVYIIDPDTGDGATAGDIRLVAVFGPGQA